MRAELPVFMPAEILERATSPSEMPKTPPGNTLAASLTGTTKQHKLANYKQ